LVGHILDFGEYNDSLLEIKQLPFSGMVISAVQEANQGFSNNILCYIYAKTKQCALDVITNCVFYGKL
jgi:hypothetical protein